MSWICTVCKQEQSTKTAFRPIMNHTHSIEELNAVSESQEPATPVLNPLQREVEAKLEQHGLTDAEIATILGELT
ncbi:MAG: hypothetical protein ACREHV_14410 [Rhizomicrobium sp.]